MISETYAELGPVQSDHSVGPLERRYTDEASSFLGVRGARVHYRDEGPHSDALRLSCVSTQTAVDTWPLTTHSAWMRVESAVQ